MAHQVNSRQQKSRKTIVFLPIDAHGHTNAMLSLASELKMLNYRTIFVNHTNKTPTLYGHELILIEEQQVDPEEAHDTNNNSNSNGDLNEQDVFLSAKLFDHDWDDQRLNFNVDLIDGSVGDEITLRTTEKNFNLWPRVAYKSRDTDAILERTLIDLKPDLVVTELTPIRPALLRLARDSYAKKVAGWDHGLKWMSLVSLAPLWLYYFAHIAAKKHKSTEDESGNELCIVPNPLWGLPIRRKLSQKEYENHSDGFMRMLRVSGFVDATVQLGRLGLIKGFDGQSIDDNLLGSLFLNESPWLNIFMFPSELDYESDFKSLLDKSRWIRADSLVRPTSSISKPLDPMSEQLLSELVAWNESKPDNESKIIYVSLGTVVSESMEVMIIMMQQIFHCLEKRPNWRFAMSLGKKYKDICTMFKTQLDRWQKKEPRLIARGWWPQPEVFRRHLVDACVVHGGNNTTCELFHYSPPPALVVVPGIGDQLDNARRLEELDLGVSLPVGRLLRYTTQEVRDTLLLNALDEALEMHESSKGLQKFQTEIPRRDASYCARIVSDRLEYECNGLA